MNERNIKKSGIENRCSHGHSHSHSHRHSHGHSHGISSIDSLAYQSELRFLPPEFKVFFALFYLTVVIVADQIWLSVWLLAVMAVISCGMGKIPVRDYMRTMRIPLFFVLAGGLVVIFGVNLEPVGDLWVKAGPLYIYMTYTGLREGMGLMLKAFAAISCLFAMTLSTPSGEIIYVMKKIHMPSLIIELMYLIYRYIFILSDVHDQIKKSAQSRLGYVDFVTSCRTFSGTASNLLVSAMQRAGACYDAMLSRCYDGELNFLEEEKEMPWSYVAGAVGIFLLTVVLFLLWNN